MEVEGLPVGPALAWTPPPLPQRRVLTGRTVRLEPVDATHHAGDLFELSRAHPALWVYLGYGPFADLAEFSAWLGARAQQSDPLFFTIVDAASGRASGMASF